MVEETKTQAVASRAKGGRKVYDKKHPKWNCTFDDALTNALCSTIDTTGEYNEIRSIQMESSLLGKPFADDTLFSNLQKCTICHPMYKETVATVSQLTFSALATALTTWQLVIENNPSQRVDPHQASTRVTSSNDQDESSEKDEKDKKDADCTSAKVAARP
ncbi:hypothetical protein NDA14_000395 [Ustilago hordei]|nr:hypothetical protein NDA14_000395 [Ustilago hordei]